MLVAGVQMQDYQEEKKPPGLFYHVFSKFSQTPSAIIKPLWKNNKINVILELYDDCLFLKSTSEVSCLNFSNDIFFGYNMTSLQFWFDNKQTKSQENFVTQNVEELQKFIEQLKNKCSQQKFNQQYLIINQISKSKNCQICKIQRKIDLTQFAVKILLNSSKIQQQIEILKKLKHPNLIYLREYFIQEDNTVYIVMDYQDGNLLDKIKSQDDLSCKQKLKIVIDMLNALQFLRIKGIVHRDIKPENILYSNKDGNFKIADFGIAMYCGDIITKRSGTPGYMAPELLGQNCEIEANILSDIYSMGLTFYQMFTKRQYYVGQDQQEILDNNKSAISFRKKSFPSQDPYKIQKKLLQKMIRKKSEDRNNSLQIMKSSIYRKISLFFGKQSSVISSPQKSSSSEEQKFMDSVKKLFKFKSSF